MKQRPTDLAQYELLHGETNYDFDFKLAPATELLVDVYADKPVSCFLHIRKGEIDRWIPVVSGERRIELRARFSNLVGVRLSCSKDATLNCLVVGNSIGIDPIDYTPRTAKLEMPAPTMAELVAKEVKKLLPTRPQRETVTDPELMGDEIAEKHQGFEIDDNDPLDPADGVVLEPDEPARNPLPDDSGTGPDTDRGPERARARERRDELTAPDKRPASTPDAKPRPPSQPSGHDPEPEIADPRQRDYYLG